MLERVCITPGNKYTYTIFIDNSLIYNTWGKLNVFLFRGGGPLEKIIEKLSVNFTSDTEHYILHCPQLCTLRQTLLGQISHVGFDIANMSTKDHCFLLYGKTNGNTIVNRMILEATISFIKSSKRFA